MLRRDVLISGAAAALGQGLVTDAHAAYGDIPPLKTTVPYPLGVAATDLQLKSTAWSDLATTHFSQLTAEWEMKMEYILQDNGSLNFDRADRLVDFARNNKMSVHGHTLIWYAQDGVYFQKLANKPDAFLNAYVDYITRIMQRYRGKIRGWDVVNEPIVDNGTGLRACLWRKVLGDDYIGLAFEAAHRADPNAILFLNDYNLEFTPQKRTTFLKLVESLLKNGAPVHGIGTQTHLDASIAPGLIRNAMRDIASLGLKVHVSEVDISIRETRNLNIADLRMKQLRVLNEVLTAYADIPAPQRYGMTIWGLRDSDSWLNSPSSGTKLIADEPLLFDRLGRPKPLAQAFVYAAK